MPLDLNLSPLYRINGREETNMPGVLALSPPRNAARGREQDRLIVYLLLAGNSSFTTTEYKTLAEDAARIYYQTARTVTSALRTAADHVNKALLERNMSTSARGKYALGWLLLVSMRDTQCILSFNGPMRAYWFGQNESQQLYEPPSSDKGLGSSQNVNIHFAQATLNENDLLLLCGRVPNAWVAPLGDARPSSLDAMRRRLVTLTNENLNAVLIQSKEGTGAFNFLRTSSSQMEDEPEELPPPPEPGPSLPVPEQAESTPAHVLQPSAYAIPPQEEAANDPLANLPRQATPRDFPASIPRAKPKPEPISNESVDEEIVEADDFPPPVLDIGRKPEPPREPSQRTRQTAKTMATGIQSMRRWSEVIGEKFRGFLPRLLPNTDTAETSSMPSSTLMIFLAILIPLAVVTIASVMYLRYGRSEQYDAYLRQAQQMHEQALTLSNPIEQRKAWENVLLSVDRAEEHRQTTETINLRKEAESNLDVLLGITRMKFNPAFTSRPGIEISRMAAGEDGLYMLNAANGEVLRASPAAGGGFQMDNAFNCKPGVYGNYTVGPLVDILALPVVNFIDATLLGIDANGNLLYCKPGQVGQAIPLPPPDTNWGRVTGFALDNGTLYVLDAPSRAVWVYNGNDGTYVDRPYFFFGQQTPTQDVIDFIVSGDEMYMLHADGRLSTCSYSRINTSTSNCQDPLRLDNPFQAYQDIDLFGAAHFTQILYAAPPDPSILLLDTDGQSLMRFAPRTLELQNQFRPTTGSGNPIPAGTVGAVAVSPDHVLYLAVNGQVYFAVNMP